ncbi:hypothetical protein A7P96_09020 [Eikenella sp. NML03-A-027]|nr:hypothetical protein A7P96_09020 [Eikenella sp. NML03-A-027]
MCGAEIPRWLRLKLQSYADDTASIKALGLDVVTEMCGRLLRHGAPACISTPSTRPDCLPPSASVWATNPPFFK